MFSTNLLTFLGSGRNQCAPRQMVGFPKEPTRALVNGGDGLLTEDRMTEACDFQVVIEIILHALPIHTFEMTPGDYPRGQRERRFPVELIQEIILSGQDDGKDRFRITLKLGQGVKFGKDFEA